MWLLCGVGGTIGGCLGEKLGEDAVERSGLKKQAEGVDQKVQEGARKVRDKLGNVIGEENVDKAEEIALIHFGLSDDESCGCFPCLPSSQILFFIMLVFSIYTWYRLAIGISFQNGCLESASHIKVNNTSQKSGNSTKELVKSYRLITGDNSTLATYLVEYPCEFGFHYMVAGAVVWACFFTVLHSYIIGQLFATMLFLPMQSLGMPRHDM